MFVYKIIIYQNNNNIILQILQGWGRASRNVQQMHHTLQQAQMPIVNSFTCSYHMQVKILFNFASILSIFRKIFKSFLFKQNKQKNLRFYSIKSKFKCVRIIYLNFFWIRLNKFFFFLFKI